MLNRRVLRVRVLQYLYSYYSLIKFSDKPEQLKPDFIRNLSTSLPPIGKKHMTTKPAGAVTNPEAVGVKFWTV